MQNKIIQILVATVAIIIALLLITNTVALDTYSQISTIVGILAIALIFIIKRKLAFDYKLLAITLMGYAFGGKGFAYITPFEPVYIGEITLLTCSIGLSIRYLKGAKRFPTGMHWMVFAWITTVNIYVFYGFPQYRLLAIRDSAIGYYGLFFFTSYAIFQSNEHSKAFVNVLKACVILSYISSFLVTTGLYDYLIPAMHWSRRFFLPHADALIPLVASGTVYGFMEGITKKSILNILFGLVGFCLLILSKTAGIFCLGTVMLLLIFLAKRIDVLFTSIIALLLSGIFIAILVVSGNDFVEEKILESDQIQTIQDVGNASGKGNTSTTDWRLAWWTIIAQDTLEENPLTGVGMGGDVTTHFLEAVMRVDPLSKDAANYARYPHNIVFNVFGRMGIIGLVIFGIFFLSLIRFSLVFTSRYLSSKTVDAGALLALSIFFSGLMNALVQATYEVPHGAIMNWTCLAYLVCYDRKHQLEKKQASTALSGNQPSNSSSLEFK